MSGSRTAKITLSCIAELTAGDEVRDAEMKGFGVRRQSEAITYFVHTRINGQLKRLTIGRHGSPWTPETARKEAARLLISIRAGDDPAAERDARRHVSEPFEAVATRFLEVHGRRLKPRTKYEYEKMIRNQLGRSFGGKPFSDITRVDVARAHTQWSKTTPRTANHALAVLSKMMSWAVVHGYREGGNPCTKVERNKESKRERYLSDAELIRVGEVLADLEAENENPWAIGVIRMLIFSGARVSEMLTLRWEYLDASRRILRLPDSKTGAKTIHLNAEALAVLDALPRMDKNPWVFPGRFKGEHLTGVNKVWSDIRVRAGIEDVRIHDLRHSFASIAVEVGGTLPMIGRLLGHTQAQTTARYAHVAPSPAHRVADAAGRRIAEAWSKGGETEKTK